MSIYVEVVGGHINLDKVDFVAARREEKGYTYHAHIGGDVYRLTQWGAKRFSETSDTGLVHVVPNTRDELEAVVFFADTDDESVQSEDDIKLVSETYSVVAWRVDCDGDDYNSAKPVLFDYDPASNEVMFVHNTLLDTYQIYGYSPLSLQKARDVAKEHLFNRIRVNRNKHASSVELQLD